jgi:hypothetical protein
MIKNQQNSVTKKDPHLGKKNYYYFFSFSFSLIYWNKLRKLFFSNSKRLITDIQGIDNEVKKYKKNMECKGVFFGNALSYPKVIIEI